MDLKLIRKMCESRDGGLKKLAMDIGMSEANLHRCINNNKIQASDLENISLLLNVKIGVFFGEEDVKNDEVDKLREEVKTLKSLLSIQDGDKIFKLWTMFMANQQQCHELMKDMTLMYTSMMNNKL